MASAALKARQVLSATTATPPVTGTIFFTPRMPSAALASKLRSGAPLWGLIRTAACSMPSSFWSMP